MTWNGVRGTLPKTAGEVAVVLVVFATGVLVGTKAQPAPAEWFSFAGAMVGAAITVAGSVYVLNHERKRGDEERRELLISLLADVDASCLPFQVANDEALRERYGRTARQQASDLAAAIGRLRRIGGELRPTSAHMMKLSEAIEEVVVDPDLRAAAAAAARYSRTADFGKLNEIGHGVMSKTAAVRALLEKR